MLNTYNATLPRPLPQNLIKCRVIGLKWGDIMPTPVTSKLYKISQTNGDDREATPVPEPDPEPTTATKPEPERPLPAAFGRSLVDLVRQHTSASHQACQATVQALMTALREAAPSVQVGIMHG